MKEIGKIELRNLLPEDYSKLKDMMIRSYHDWAGAYWKEPQVQTLLNRFPEGQFVILADDELVGCALSIIIDYDRFGDDHTYKQITGSFTFDTHTPDGDVLYGIDVFIHPDYRGLRLGRRLYDARKELCEQLNLKSIVFGGRIPNYNKFSDTLKPKEYIQKVLQKEIFDPVLTFQLSNDFRVIKVLKDYMPGDKSSKEYATLLEWNNIYHAKEEHLLKPEKVQVRIGLVQWMMRPVSDLQALFSQMEFFVDAVSDYKADFVMFPELFNAPLMADYNHLPESDAIRKLAEFTEPIRDKCKEFAISYNVNIITGSMPMMRDGSLYNVGYLCRRDGSHETYEKIHITPSEVSYWGMVGGNSVKVFDTDSGKIGILICYDVEFPELSRIMAEDGMQILFVPFQTDTQNGYTRVQRCAMARAIENECYVAVTGSVGNLPKVNNMDLQYAQASVFTPSDFSFPTNGIKAEATPNTEMTLIVDVDLDLLRELHSHGSVRNLKDRRKDLYQLQLK
jgi:predicted amidohydrolase/GNAT superfamily N-acetyltransferase